MVVNRSSSSSSTDLSHHIQHAADHSSFTWGSSVRLSTFVAQDGGGREALRPGIPATDLSSQRSSLCQEKDTVAKVGSGWVNSSLANSLIIEV